MNISFFLDVKLVKKDDGFYTTGAVAKEYLNRHRMSNEDILTVVCRRNTKQNLTSKLAIASDKNINFVLFDSYIDALKNKHIIKKIICESDVVNVKLPTNIGLVAMHYVLKYKKKHMIQLVGCPYDSLMNHGSILAKIIAPFICLMNKYYIKKAENVIYVTDKFLQDRYPTKGNCISCSDVDISSIESDVLNKRINHINENNSTYKIGLIGSLDVKYKGHDIAIKAVSLLRNKFNIELHFLGNGDKSNWVKLAKKYDIEDKVFFDGTLPSGEAVYNWLDMMDIYIQPSLTEGLPRALVEAMSRACPVIGTRTGGIPELIEDKRIVNKNDYKDLSEKINSLLSNPKLMKDSAIRNHKKSAEFGKKVLEERRNQFYIEILNSIKMGEV